MRKLILVATAVIAVALGTVSPAAAGGTGGTGNCVEVAGQPTRCTVSLDPAPVVTTAPAPVATTIPASTPVVTTPRRPTTGIGGVPTPPTTVAAVIVPAIPQETGGNTGGGESAGTTPAPGAPQETAAALPKEEAPAEPAASSTPVGTAAPASATTPAGTATPKAVAKAATVPATASVVSGVLAPALVPVASAIAVSPVTSSLSLSWMSAMWPQGFLALFVCGGAALGTVLIAKRRQAEKLDTNEIDFDLGILSLLEEDTTDEVSSTDIYL